MKLAVVGSRSLHHEVYRVRIYQLIDAYRPNLEEIVSGGAAGIDTFAAEYAKDHEIPLKVFLPDWQRFGRSGGYRRNVQIVRYADAVLAFWDGRSKGTQHSVALALEHHRPCQVFHLQQQ